MSELAKTALNMTSGDTIGTGCPQRCHGRQLQLLTGTLVKNRVSLITFE
jgi:hypothetical protein